MITLNDIKHDIIYSQWDLLWYHILIYVWSSNEKFEN